MTKPNPYAPPEAPEAPAVASQGVKAWFRGRPIPVFIIGALCILQFLVLLNLARKIGIRYPGGSPEGSFSPLDLVVFLTGPALLLAAGMFLVFMHCRTAAVLFACCVVWRVGALVAGPAADPIDYLGPALMSGFLAYSLWIAARTRHVAGLGERAATRP